jgi:hypothetical protein
MRFGLGIIISLLLLLVSFSLPPFPSEDRNLRHIHGLAKLKINRRRIQFHDAGSLPGVLQRQGDQHAGLVGQPE